MDKRSQERRSAQSPYYLDEIEEDNIGTPGYIAGYVVILLLMVLVYGLGKFKP